MGAWVGVLWLMGAVPVLPVTTQPVNIHVSDASVTTVGKLGYLAGFSLTVDDPRFGGLSGFDFAPDGTLVGVSDRGHWITLTLEHAPNGRLRRVVSTRIEPIRGTRGQLLSKRWGDAEEMTILPDGSLLVSFEHEHRLARYEGLSTLGTALEQPWLTLTGLRDATPNGGVEAMTIVSGGRLLALREKPLNSAGTFSGWLLDPATGAEHTFQYTTTDGFEPTGIALAGDDIVLVLERRYSTLTGIAARLVMAKLAAFESAAPVRTTQVARFGGEITCDNFEALATRPMPGGGTAIYIGSDDNYNRPNQRTLLLQLLYSPGKDQGF